MPLPKIATPTYELTLPSTGKKIKFRPFLVHEHKLFLLTLEGLSDKEEDKQKNQKNIVDVIKQIAKNCILDPNIDIDSLALFDVEYIFLQLRAKSINDKLDLFFKGRSKEDTECVECQKQKHIQVDLNSIQILKSDKHNKKIQLTDKVGVIMKYPTYSLYSKMQTLTNSDAVNTGFEYITNCIESIYDETNMYDVSEYSQKDLYQFIEQLTSSQYEKIEQFFDSMPKLYHKIEMKCKSCGFIQTYEMDSINDFFE